MFAFFALAKYPVTVSLTSSRNEKAAIAYFEEGACVAWAYWQNSIWLLDRPRRHKRSRPQHRL